MQQQQHQQQQAIARRAKRLRRLQPVATDCHECAISQIQNS